MKRTIRDYDDDDEEENEAAVGGDGQARGEAGWTARSRRHGLSAVAWSGAAVAVADDDAPPRHAVHDISAICAGRTARHSSR